MTLKGVTTVILRYFTAFDSFGTNYVTVVEVRSVLKSSAKIYIVCGNNLI